MFQVVSCMAQALCLALMDAALPLRTTLSALSCVFKEDGDMITDPTSEEEEEFVSKLTYVIDRQGDLLCSHTYGLFTTEQVNNHFLVFT